MKLWKQWDRKDRKTMIKAQPRRIKYIGDNNETYIVLMIYHVVC